MENIFVIIPAFNPDKHLLNVINGLLKLEMKHIIVVNDGSKDATWDIIEKLFSWLSKHLFVYLQT